MCIQVLNAFPLRLGFLLLVMLNLVIRFKDLSPERPLNSELQYFTEDGSRSMVGSVVGRIRRGSEKFSKGIKGFKTLLSTHRRDDQPTKEF